MEEFDDLDQLKLQGLVRLDQAKRHAAEQQVELKGVRRELRKLREDRRLTLRVGARSGPRMSPLRGLEKPWGRSVTVGSRPRLLPCRHFAAPKD